MIGQIPEHNAPFSEALHGEALLQQLRQGWASLPHGTVVALVMSGLRVRLLRSTVTLLSIVLAIAFLSYTGLSNQQAKSLALEVLRLEDQPAINAQQVTDAASRTAAIDLFGSMARDEQRGVAIAMGLDDVFEQEIELTRLNDQIVRAEREQVAKRERHAEVTEKLDSLGAAAATDLEEIGKLNDEKRTLENRLDKLPLELQKLVPLQDALAIPVGLGKWLRSESAEAGQDMPMRLAESLSNKQTSLLELVQARSRLSEHDLATLQTILTLAGRDQDQNNSTADVNTMQTYLDQELSKRAASDLRMLLRRATVDVDKTLAGNPLDTWLIIMALLTCAVGIANAMLMSVTERIREIGTMKCLGAQDGLVIKLFLLESAVLGAVGAALGIVVGVLVALFAGLLQFKSFGWSHFPVLQGWVVILWSVVSGLLLAVCGAVYPAFAASRMRPVDALRVDE